MGSRLEKALRQVRAKRSSVLFPSVMFGQGMTRYVSFRLRYQLATYGVMTLVQVIEYVYFYDIFFYKYQSASLMALALSSLLIGFVWGALESLRTQMREQTEKDSTGQLASIWLSWAAVAAMLLCAGIGLYLYSCWYRRGAVSPSELFAGACFLRLAGELVVRVLFSGIYAKFRVYRPLAVNVGIEVGGFGLTYLLWPVCGAWSFVWAFFAATLVNTVASLVYVRRAYELHREVLPRIRRRYLAAYYLKGLELAHALAAGISFLSQRMGSLLVVWFIYRQEDSAIPIVLYLVSPLLNAAATWMQPFYFDFKKYGSGEYTLLLLPFKRYLERFAYVYGGFLWVLASGVCLTYFPVAIAPLLLAMGPLFVMRSRLCVDQMLAFVERRYRYVAMVSLLIAGLPVAQVLLGWPLSDELVLAGLSVCLLLMKGLLRRRSQDQPLSPPGEYAFAFWRQRVAAGGLPYRQVITFLPNRRTYPAAARALRRYLAEARRTQWLAFLSAHRLVLAAATPIDRGDILTSCPGMIARIDPVQELHHLIPKSPDSSDALSFFREQFPDGVAIEAGRTTPQIIRQQDSAAHASLLFKVTAFLRWKSMRTVTPYPYDVAVLTAAGVIRVILLIPKEADRLRKQHLHEQVRRENLRN